MNELTELETDHNPEPQRRSILSDWKIWVIFFTYTFVMGLFIQFILLPYLFPSWHEGNGLLKGYDYTEFDRLAVELSGRMKVEGWSVWEPTPGGQFVSGVAAIFYTLITPKPWTLLPLNAALQASAAFILLKMLVNIARDRRIALAGTLPFVLFPSSLTWTSQIHNDSYAILGFMLFVYGWMVIARVDNWNKNSRIIKGFLLVITGALLIWLVRSFVVEVLIVVSIVIALSLTVIFFIAASKRKIKWSRILFLSPIPWLLVLTIIPFMTLNVNRAFDCVLMRNSCKSDRKDLSNPVQQIINTDRVERAERLAIEVDEPLIWNETPWLPDFIDRRFKALSLERDINLFNWSDATSNVDVGVELNDALEVMMYSPRALEIGLLAPFPSEWLGQGSRESSTLMRRISALEMTAIYLALLLVPYSLWRWRASIELWVMLLFCIAMLLIYSIVTPNVGTLYRFRYPYLMTIVALGVAGGIMLSEKLRRKWKSESRR